MRTRKRRLRWIAVALASMLLAAPAAQARLDEDEGGATPSEPPPVTVAAPDGFSWIDAGIGAGAALGVVLVAGGAGRAVRRHSLPAHS
jgi:hypothetical protein